MSALSIQVPFPVFQGRDGQPLENGYVWIGEPNLNPQTNPVVAYFDAALTIPAPQPLRTLNGFISRAGTPAQIYVDAVNFSILVQDSKGSMVYNFPDGSGISPNAAGVEYDPVGTGAIPQDLQTRLRNVAYATDYTTLQNAIDAIGPTGSLIIPQSYAGTDSYTNTHEISIIDLRTKPNSPGGSVGGIGIYSVLETNGDNTFPMGNDLVVRAKGSADMYLEHLNIRCTTTQSLIVGENFVTIGPVSVGNDTRGSVQTGNAYLFSDFGALMVGRETANEEQVNPPNFSIVSATVLRIVCTEPHTGTTDIEMIGSTLLSSWDLFINSNATEPSQLTGYDAPLRVKDLGGRIIAYVPSNIDNPIPYGAWQWGCFQTGAFGVNKDLFYRLTLPASKVIWRNSSDIEIASLNDTGRLEVTSGVSGGIGAIKTDGTDGEVQLGGRLAGSLSLSNDAFVTWANNTAPLNPSATSGSLLLAGRNIASAEVVIAAENTVNVRVAKDKIGFNGSAPVAKPTLPAAGADPLVNAIRTLLINCGLAD